ncbi:MAG: bifunctional UDP-N-acetylmuramoyl-tripeptide:D-alanyl-D-alanine ligase/alanine racemase [Flavobacteriales bacterium AspAUS03]
MKYSLDQVAAIIGLIGIQTGLKGRFITQIALDSRSIDLSERSLFFALKTLSNDGHRYIEEAYLRETRAFIVSNAWSFDQKKVYPGAVFLVVENPLLALQVLAAHHRRRFDLKCIAVTGSNGKTIVKEWLNHSLGKVYTTVRSPKSYNSQIGVPLSLWEIRPEHQLGIFEAGISHPGEMGTLRELIAPEIGILTNIGAAHSGNFPSKQIHIGEKLQLFTGCQQLICPADDLDLLSVIDNTPALAAVEKHYWGRSSLAELRLQRLDLSDQGTTIEALYRGKMRQVAIPFSDLAAIEDALTVWLTLLVLGWGDEAITVQLATLPNVKMRLEMIKGLNNCLIINDTDNSDLQSIKIALDLLSRQKFSKKTLILSDVLQTFPNGAEKYKRIADWAAASGVDRVIGVGEEITAYGELFTMLFRSFLFTEELLDQIKKIDFRDEALLMKGARSFAFEKLLAHLEKRFHQTVYEIDLKALAYNLNYFRSRLGSKTKIMVMVKAFSYGGGSYEIANTLQYHKVDYLGVAYVDEGVALRKDGVTLPILVMNSDRGSFAVMVEHYLEPEIYNFGVLNDLLTEVTIQAFFTPYPIHIKIDTGMHRLGFLEDEMVRLGRLLQGDKRLVVRSIFSHLVASEDPKEIDFTLEQIAAFERSYTTLVSFLEYHPMRHILNSSGIVHFPNAQYEMVRLGLGLYGISPDETIQRELRVVCVLKTTISQIKTLQPGETVGYGRRFEAKAPTRVATLPIGYADGIDRRLGNGKGYVVIGIHRATIIGEVCMDMIMVDVTGIDCQEGDQVVLLGERPTVTEIAQLSGTIAYEVLTSISPRVKRVYFEE